jgi:hypothetical protein
MLVAGVVPASHQTTTEEARPRRRADAERSIARILDAAVNTGAETHEELHHRHGSVLGTLPPLVERGQADGVFRTDVPAGWHLAMVMTLIHAGSAELQARRVPEAGAEAALVATVLGALSASPGV